MVGFGEVFFLNLFVDVYLDYYYFFFVKINSLLSSTYNSLSLKKRKHFKLGFSCGHFDIISLWNHMFAGTSKQEVVG